MYKNHPDFNQAWTDLKGHSPNAKLLAVAGAYALVACCDRELQESEARRFMDWATDAQLFEQVDKVGFERAFRQVLRALTFDFAQGYPSIEGAISAVAGASTATLAVIRASQLAVVADGRLQEVEELQLARVCELLGVDPEGI